MNFTIVDIAIAFTLGYVLGALGCGSSRKYDENLTLRKRTQLSRPHAKTTFEGLDEEDRTTGFKRDPISSIAKAPKPANFDELDSYGQDTQGSIELVEPLPEAPDREDVEDTEDLMTPVYPVSNFH